MTALASPPARSGRPFLDAFLPNFEGIFEGFCATPGMALSTG
jgi:hypothetical protein